MPRAALAVLLAAALAAGACANEPEPPPEVQRQSAPTTAPTTTTTAPPESTTTSTTAPVPPTLTGSEPAKAIVSGRGVVLPVIAPAEGGGFTVTTPCGKRAVVVTGNPIESASVVLDPGHGGDEPGAIGPNGLTERVLNQAVAEHAKAALERVGLSTLLTKTSPDYRMTLTARAEVVQALKPKAFVSIHHNAEPDGPFPRPGAETYYQLVSPESKRLSGLIYEEVVQALSQYQIAWVADTDAGAKYRTNSKGADYYGILRRTAGVPSVLAELGFVSNPPEAELYARPDVQKVEGEAVARGIIRFLTTTDPGSGFTEPYPRTSPAGSGGGASNCTDPPL